MGRRLHIAVANGDRVRLDQLLAELQKHASDSPLSAESSNDKDPIPSTLPSHPQHPAEPLPAMPGRVKEGVNWVREGRSFLLLLHLY